jgi:predicted enzyme related to lactoylglutathione lyase
VKPALGGRDRSVAPGRFSTNREVFIMAARRTRPSRTTKRVARARAVPKRRVVARTGTARATAARKRAGRAATSATPRGRSTASAKSRAQDGAPDAIGFVSQHMDYTSHDIEAVKRFYTRLLGFTDFQYVPANQYLAVRTGPTSSIGFMPPMPGPPEDWRPPREPTLYLFVADVDRACRELESRGVVIDRPPADMPWGHRVAQLRDPEGRSVTLAQNRRRR